MNKIVTFSAMMVVLSALAAHADEEGSLELSLTRVRLLMETAQTDDAFQLIESLKKDYPDNTDVLTAEAELYFYTNNRGKSLEVIRHAAQIDPENEDILERANEILSGQETFAAAEGEFRKTGDSQREYITRVKGQVTMNRPLALAVILENNRLRATDFTRTNGTVETIRDDFMRGEIGGIYTINNGDQAKASLYLAENTVGVGANYGLLDSMGISTFGAEYNRPNWEYTALVVDEGTRDSLYVSRTHIITPRLVALGKLSLNRYNVEDIDDVARSGGVEFNVDYTLPQRYTRNYLGENSLVKLDYIFNAEYSFDVTERTDPLIGDYTPLALQHYEIQTVEIVVQKKLFNTLNLQAHGGYAADRFGGSGPVLGGSASWQPTNNIVLEALATRTINKEDTGDEIDVVGVNVKWIL
jgi:hypothetical protein